jgi:hypothetical protein
MKCRPGKCEAVWSELNFLRVLTKRVEFIKASTWVDANTDGESCCFPMAPIMRASSSRVRSAAGESSITVRGVQLTMACGLTVNFTVKVCFIMKIHCHWMAHLTVRTLMK